MQLNIIIEDKTTPVDLAQELISSGSDIFDKMDRDMSRGWQMSRSWIESPTLEQRCQIIADKLLLAVEQENKASVGMYCAYILSRLEGVTAVDVDTTGDMTETRFTFS